MGKLVDMMESTQVENGMELRATKLGQRLAQHPYNRVRLLNAGIEVSGERHQYLIPFNQLMALRCKRGLVWGELEFELPDQRVVRLHGTDWQETQRFHQQLMQRWDAWSESMAQISAEVLQAQCQGLQALAQRDGWLTRADLTSLVQEIDRTLQALPLPVQRLEAFPVCAPLYHDCVAWRDEGEQRRQQHNRRWSQRVLSERADFFAEAMPSPLNDSQALAVVNGEQNVLVLAGAGSGKTSVLLARCAWLLQGGQTDAEQILPLAFGRRAAQEMTQRLRQTPGCAEVQARTFHGLALYIVNQTARRPVAISRLASDREARDAFLLAEWQRQCAEKKSQANGWRQWLTLLFDALPEREDFWQDTALQAHLAPRLAYWIGLLREHGGSQAAMVEQASEALRAPFQQRLRLLAPLLKAWKAALKQEGALDFPALLQQAQAQLEKGRFISPWRHILVDEFQDISPQRARLLAALRSQNSHSALFAVGDDWQAIYRFSGAQLTLTTAFHHYFGEGECCRLDTSYRFNRRIGEIANGFVQQNPHQAKKTLNALRDGDRQSVTLLPQDQLEALLDKLSGYVRADESILILARYHHLRPALLDRAATRWPGLDLHFMTLHGSKGCQADYVIVLGLHEGRDGFPAPEAPSVIEEVLLPAAEPFPDAEERRLLYVALTRARHRVWLLQDPLRPSRFVAALQRLGAVARRKA